MEERVRDIGRSWLGRSVAASSVLVLVACGASAATTGSPGTTSTTAGTMQATAPIVGRWMQVHTCDQLVAGLE